jgi:hypothetical protein
MQLQPQVSGDFLSEQPARSHGELVTIRATSAAVGLLASICRGEPAALATIRGLEWYDGRESGGRCLFARSHYRPERVICNSIEGPLAQRLVQRTHNPLVDGSNPSGPTRSAVIQDAYPINTSASVVTTYPKAIPNAKQAPNAIAGGRPRLPLTRDVRHRPSTPPAMHPPSRLRIRCLLVHNYRPERPKKHSDFAPSPHERCPRLVRFCAQYSGWRWSIELGV